MVTQPGWAQPSFCEEPIVPSTGLEEVGLVLLPSTGCHACLQFLSPPRAEHPHPDQFYLHCSS